jgi:hypothetical protein
MDFYVSQYMVLSGCVGFQWETAEDLGVKAHRHDFVRTGADEKIIAVKVGIDCVSRPDSEIDLIVTLHLDRIKALPVSY